MTAARQLALAQKQALNECSLCGLDCHTFNADGYSCVQMCADQSRFVNRASNGCPVMPVLHWPKKPKTEGRTPLATIQRSLLAVHALFWDECTPQRPHSDVPGFTQPFDRGVLRALSGRLEQRKFALTSLTYQLLALTPSFTQITCHKKSCAGRRAAAASCRSAN